MVNEILSDSRDSRVIFEMFRHSERVGAVPLYAQRQCLDTLQQQEGRMRRQACSKIAQDLDSNFDRVGDRSKVTPFDSMIRWGGRCELFLELGGSGPGECTSINNDASNGRAMATDPLGE